MRSPFPSAVEAARVRAGHHATEPGGRFGAFQFPNPTAAEAATGALAVESLFVLVSDGYGWEHASAQVIRTADRRTARAPSWDEMCRVKDWFFGPDEWVVQYHPARAAYVNAHPNVLHLWRPTSVAVPVPPRVLVGPPPDAAEFRDEIAALRAASPDVPRVEYDRAVVVEVRRAA